MADESDPSREAIHAAIQEHAPRGEDAVLTGWVMVAEWMDHDGERWLSKAHSAATGQIGPRATSGAYYLVNGQFAHIFDDVFGTPGVAAA